MVCFFSFFFFFFFFLHFGRIGAFAVAEMGYRRINIGTRVSSFVSLSSFPFFSPFDALCMGRIGFESDESMR